MVRPAGSFAPPLTDELLVRYALLIDSAQARLRPSLQSLLHCCQVWWRLPTSTGPTVPHPSGQGKIQYLDNAVVMQLPLPGPDELATLESLLESITTPELRNMAFHLLWHVKEFLLYREPITTDTL